MFGAPVVFARATSGRPKFSGVNVNGTIVLMRGGQDAHVALTMHEVVHGMPEDVKAELLAAIRPHMNREAFVRDFPNYQADKVDEEIVGRLAQQHAKTPQFWRELSLKMGDNAFAKMARSVLDALDRIIARFHQSELDKYAHDIEKVRDALTTAFAETARRAAARGAQPQDSAISYAEDRGRKADSGHVQYRVFRDGSVSVKGKAPLLLSFMPEGIKGERTPEGLTFRGQHAKAALDAIRERADRLKAGAALRRAVARKMRLTPEEEASTALEFMTGQSGGRSFVTPRVGDLTETVRFLENRRRASGLRTLDIGNETDRATLARLMAAEALAAIRSAGNAVEWYDKTISRTLGAMSLKYPELRSDPYAQTAFLAAVAITSQNMNVEDNLRFGSEQYEAWQRDGKFPERGTGKSAEAMAQNFKLYNEMRADMHDPLLARFLRTPFTVGELQGAGFDVGGELVDEQVLGSSVFGPKIGFGFFSNLTGNFEPVTMDMWFMRTVGRLTGKLREFDEARFTKQLGDFRRAFADRGDNGIFADQFDPDLVQRAQEDVDAAVELARKVDSQHQREFSKRRAEFDSGARVKTKLVNAAATILSSMDAPRDAPSSGGERRLLRDVVRRMAEEVRQAHGARIPPASLQALILYPEQELYKALGTRLRVTSQDYAGAAEKILKEQGYAERDIRAAAEQGPGRARPVASEAVAGADQGPGAQAGELGPLSPDERAAFLAERTEREQLRRERENPRRAQVVFEVAPDPNNERLATAWRSLSHDRRGEISRQVARQIAPRVLDALGNSGIFIDQVGSYLADTNPSFALLLDKGGSAVEAAKMLGFVLSQDSMMVVSPRPVKGASPTGAVVIDIGNKSVAEIDEIYQTLRAIEIAGERPVGGQSTVNGKMVVLNFSGVDTHRLAHEIESALNSGHTINVREVYAAFPSKQEYDYASERDDPRGGGRALRQRARDLRAEAQRAVEEAVRDSGVNFSEDPPGPAEPAGRPGSRGDAPGRPGQVRGAIHYSTRAGLSVLSGRAFGSGIRGAELARLADPGVDPRIKRRVYFYLPVAGGIPAPEAGLGGHVYSADLGNLYDRSAMPALRAPDPNAFESAVLDAGYRGYINREQGTAVVLDSDVPVRYVGPSSDQTRVERRVERIKPQTVTRREGDELVRRISNDEFPGAVKARPALAAAAPSFRLQFGEARVLADEAPAANAPQAAAGGLSRLLAADLVFPVLRERTPGGRRRPTGPQEQERVRQAAERRKVPSTGRNDQDQGLTHGAQLVGVGRER